MCDDTGINEFFMPRMHELDWLALFTYSLFQCSVIL